jgi:hypothetical protein
MKCLFIILGESFRLGGQNTRIRGGSESFVPQIDASNTHIALINFLKNKYNLDSDVSIGTYTTQYDNDLLSIYKENLIDYKIYDDLIGINGLFQDAISRNLDNIDNYDFVFYLRVDLYLKDHFSEIFTPIWSDIRFPTVCWKKHSTYLGKPRVNDLMLYIPKKYFDKMDRMILGHEAWHRFNYDLEIPDADMDVMINTYHDSDSEKDRNPLYYIVNRPESAIWHSENETFTK